MTETKPKRRRRTTIAEGRPSRATQPRFERPDFEAIAAEEAEATYGHLAGITDPQKRLKEAVSIVAGLRDDVEALRVERDELALSATIYDGVRGIHNAAGVTRNMMSKLKVQLREQAGEDNLHAAAVKVGLPHREDWLERLPQIGTEWTILNARMTAAREVRNKLVIDLVGNGTMKIADAADVIGTTRGRVEALRRQYA